MERFESREEAGPDLLALPHIQVGVVQRKLDPRLERFVERAQTVAREDEYACGIGQPDRPTVNTACSLALIIKILDHP